MFLATSVVFTMLGMVHGMKSESAGTNCLAEATLGADSGSLEELDGKIPFWKRQSETTTTTQSSRSTGGSSSSQNKGSSTGKNSASSTQSTGSDDDVKAPIATPVEEYSYQELQRELRSRGLNARGRTPVLQARLKDAILAEQKKADAPKQTDLSSSSRKKGSSSQSTGSDDDVKAPIATPVEEYSYQELQRELRSRGLNA